MIEQRYRCDNQNCGKAKGEGNKWFVYDKKALARGVFIIRSWHDELAKTWGHLCGEQCAMTLMRLAVRQDKPDVCTACHHKPHIDHCTACEPGTVCGPPGDQCRLCLHPYHGSEVCGKCEHQGDTCYAGFGRDGEER